MDASTFAWLVPLSLMTVAIAFLVLRMNRIGSWWWSSMFTFGAFAFASSLFPAAEGAVVKPLTEDALFVLAFLSLGGGIAGRGERRVRWPVLLTLAGLTLAAAAIAVAGFQSVRWELVAVQTGIVLILLEIAWMMRGRLRHKPDRVLHVLLIVSALALTAQSIALLAIPDPTLTMASWSTSVWGLALQASGATIGVVIAVSISLVIGRDLLDDMRRVAETDPLTNALNRRGFDQASSAIVGARARGEPLALIILDIDHFKRINDRFGHWAGDSVLCAMADLLGELTGPQAPVARLGGEEFTVLLPGTDLAKARAVAETIRTAFSHKRWPDPIGAETITASFGVTDFGPGETLMMAAERADRLLYVAKNHGRDQVCFSSFSATILPADPAGIGGPAQAAQTAERGAGFKAA